MTSDAREGDKATVESKENGALSLSSSSVPIPQLNLLSNAPPPADEGHKAVHGGEGHDGGDDEASGRELIGRREAARRADRYSDMVPPSIAPLDLFVSNFSCEKNSSHHDSPVTAHDGLDPSFKSAFSDSIVSLGHLVSNLSCEMKTPPPHSSSSSSPPPP